MSVALAWLNAQVDATEGGRPRSLLASQNAQAKKVRDAVIELVAADRECDAVMAEFFQNTPDFSAKWSAACARRRQALDSFGGGS